MDTGKETTLKRGSDFLRGHFEERKGLEEALLQAEQTGNAERVEYFSKELNRLDEVIEGYGKWKVCIVKSLIGKPVETIDHIKKGKMELCFSSFPKGSFMNGMHHDEFAKRAWLRSLQRGYYIATWRISNPVLHRHCCSNLRKLFKVYLNEDSKLACYELVNDSYTKGKMRWRLVRNWVWN